MMKNTDYKKNCISHVITRFGERFAKEDFTTKSKKWGINSWIDEVLRDVLNAKNTGYKVKDGMGHRMFYKVEFMNTKPVFVLWDMFLDCAVTVLTGDMMNKSKDKI